jgi:hypothetical protein
VNRVVLALALVLAWAPRAEVHQLDEYLQASRLGLARGRVTIELDLTPGMSIAPQIFAMVDGDGNGQVAPEEIERYAREVIGDLQLRVDDRRLPLTLTRAESPTWDEIREGTGQIRLEALADVPSLTRGRHRIAYENAHQSANGVYLVNALAPTSREIAIHAQHRDALQHSIDLDVDVTSASDWAIWLAFACVGLMMLLAVRLRRGAAEPAGSAAPLRIRNSAGR